MVLSGISYVVLRLWEWVLGFINKIRFVVNITRDFPVLFYYINYIVLHQMGILKQLCFWYNTTAISNTTVKTSRQNWILTWLSLYRAQQFLCSDFGVYIYIYIHTVHRAFSCSLSFYLSLFLLPLLSLTVSSVPDIVHSQTVCCLYNQYSQPIHHAFGCCCFLYKLMLAQNQHNLLLFCRFQRTF